MKNGMTDEAKDLDLDLTQNPEKIGDVIERLSREEPRVFPTFMLFGVRDLDMEAYVEFPYFLNTVLAIRAIRERLLQGDQRYSATPDRFRLDYLGELDQGTGEVIPDEQRQLLTFKEIIDAQ